MRIFYFGPDQISPGMGIGDGGSPKIPKYRIKKTIPVICDCLKYWNFIPEIRDFLKSGDFYLGNREFFLNWRFLAPPLRDFLKSGDFPPRWIGNFWRSGDFHSRELGIFAEAPDICGSRDFRGWGFFKNDLWQLYMQFYNFASSPMAAVKLFVTVP